jgi:hypothetical protein
MTTAIQGGISPEEIIAFIQTHTEECSEQVKSEMLSAQDRTKLAKDVADLAARLEGLVACGQFEQVHAEIETFFKTHELTGAGNEQDMAAWVSDSEAWRDKDTTAQDTGATKGQIAATAYGAVAASANMVGAVVVGGHIRPDPSTSADSSPGVAQADAKPTVESWIKELNAWKDEIASDDKIGMMKLQEEADRLKRLFELGSNLISKVDGCASSIIGNIGRA